ncbi:AsmA family protein [Paremcibacter congregatus]|uniref:AsmA family protein n=1 Tax=Paremcibacter congregatus TaxID=2043170 RepID=UPI003A907334
MKKLGFGLGLLIVVLVGGILIVPSFLNWNEYKVQIEQTASDYTGRQVKIKGDMSLSLLPTSALSAKDVSVTNIAGGRADHMLSLKSLDVKVSFPSVISSLFGGKVKVEKFILVDPVIALEILEDGRGNWTFGSEQANAGAATSSKSSGADISLDKFQIVNGQISFEDLGSGRMELLRKINANLKLKSITGPFEIIGSARYKGLDTKVDLSLGKNRPGKKVPLSLKLGLLDDRVAATVMGSVILSGVDSVFSGQIAVKAKDAADVVTALDRVQGKKGRTINAIGQDFALDVQLHGVQDRIRLTDLSLQMGQSRGQGQAELSLGEAVKFTGDLAINKLDLDALLPALEKNGAVAVAPADKTGKSPEEPLPADSLKRLSGKLDVKLGALKYNNKVASQIVLAATAGDGQITLSSLSARMPGGSSLAFSGAVKSVEGAKALMPELTGKLTLNASNLRGLLDWLKMDMNEIPSGQLAQFSYTSNIKLNQDLLQLYGMTGKLDTLRFTGGLSSALGARPSYGVRLTVDNLNLDSYLLQTEDKATETPDYKKSLAVLDEFDMTYDVTARDLTVRNMKVKSAKLDGTLLGGKLDAKTITLQDAAGINLTMSGTGHDFSTKPGMSLEFTAEAPSLVPLERALKWENGIDLGQIGETKVTGSLAATFAKADVNIKSTFGVNKLDVKGTLRSATLKQFPNIGSTDLVVDGRSSSLAAVIDQFDLGLTKPRAQDDKPIRVAGRVKTSAGMVDMDGMVAVAGGQMVVKGRRKMQGQMATLDLDLDVKSKEMREFIRGLGVDFRPSAQKLGALGLKVKVTGSGEKYTLSNIVGDLGPVKLSGTGHVNMAPAKPVFDFNLKAGDIPLQDFLPPNAPQKDKRAYGNWSTDPMDLSILSAYEGRAQISAANLQYNKYNFENPTFETSLKDGVLRISNFSGRLFGGEAVLTADLDSKGVPNMTINMTVKQASLVKATQAAAGIAPVTGFFDMTGQYTAKGKSQQALMSSLSGGGKVVASPGMISGIDVPALSRRLDKMDDKKAFLSLLGTALSGGKTPYKGGVTEIVAKDGKLNFSPLDIELDGAKSKVNMDVDLSQWVIRSGGKLSLTDHPMAPPIEVDIVGDVSNPKVAFKTDRLERYVGAKIASNMLQKLVGGEGGLEGIFGQDPKKDTKTDTPASPQGTPDSATPPQGASQDPAVKENPPQDFGKRLLEKLFEKNKKTEENKPDGDN